MRNGVGVSFSPWGPSSRSRSVLRLRPEVTKNRPTPMRAVLRFVASVMMVSGVLLIADAGATLLWQEPVSAFVTPQRQQVKLEAALADPLVVERVIAAQAAEGRRDRQDHDPDDRRRPSTSWRARTPTTCARARATTPTPPCPASRGTVAIAGHRTTYGAPFRNLDKLKPRRRDRRRHALRAVRLRGREDARSSTTRTSRCSTTSATSA